MTDKKLTIADVAREAGVSATTVAHTLNSSADVPEATKARVLQVVQELEYTPNRAARSLGTQPSPQIFVSYSRDDWNEFVEPLTHRLEAEELLVWVDQYAIRSGEDWLDGINLGLELCTILVLCVTPEALNSRYVKIEYRYFLDENKVVIPLICREAKLPAELRGLQYVPYSDIDLLVEQIKERLAEQRP